MSTEDIHHHVRQEDSGEERGETGVGPAAECEKTKRSLHPPARAVTPARATPIPVTTPYTLYAMPAAGGIDGAGSTAPSGRKFEHSARHWSRARLGVHSRGVPYDPIYDPLCVPC